MTTIAISIWHNVASDLDDRPGPFLVGFTSGDPVVRVFAYQVAAGGRTAESVAEEAFATFNGHPPDARTADLSRRYYQRWLRSLSVGDVVVVGEIALAVGRPAGWKPVRGSLAEVHVHEHGTHPLEPRRREGAELAMAVLESADYQAARDRIKDNPIIRWMAVRFAVVPLSDLAHGDGTPRFEFMQHANRAFNMAEKQNADNPSYVPYPAHAPRHIGLIAEAVLAERAANREAVASLIAVPSTDPESDKVTRIIERVQAGESPVAIARELEASQ